ncbi:hypothetical protein D3C87_460370 [compost metagenome]
MYKYIFELLKNIYIYKGKSLIYKAFLSFNDLAIFQLEGSSLEIYVSALRKVIYVFSKNGKKTGHLH